MESNYKLIYASASIKDLEHAQYALISDIDNLEYEFKDLQEYSEVYLDTKRELSELKHELKYVEELIDLYYQEASKNL